MSTPVQQLSLDGRGIEHRRMRNHGAQIGEQSERLAQLQQALFGAHFGFGSDHFGPPTAPNKTASARRHSASVAAGSASPVASMAAPPSSAASNQRSGRSAAPRWSSARTASAVTSPPMPSPASTAIKACIRTPASRRRPGFIALDLGELAAQIAELIEPIQQAMARKCLDRKIRPPRPSAASAAPTQDRYPPRARMREQPCPPWLRPR